MNTSNFSTDQQYAFTGTNPFAHFHGWENKKTFTEDELLMVYNRHFPEQEEEANMEQVTAWLLTLDCNIQLV